MKILIIAGHGASDPGAVATIDGKQYKEADLTREAANLVCKALLARGADVTQYDPERNAYSDYQSGKLSATAKFEQYQYCLELHFNAAASDAKGNGKTTGVEIYWPSVGLKSGAEDALLDAVAAQGFTKRSAKAGSYAVINTAWRAGCKANILELCFLDDADDVRLWNQKKQAACEAIASALVGETAVQPATVQQFGAYWHTLEHIAYIPMQGQGETVTAAAKRKTWNGRVPDAICNCELFGSGYTPASGVVANGEAQLLTPVHGAALVDGKKPVLSYQNNLKAKDWIGSYPLLVRDGKQYFETVPAGLGGKRARVCLAWNDEKASIVFARAEEACTLEEFAAAVLGKGYHTAINLDGGGSVAVITPYVAYDQGRKVRGKLGLWLKGGTGNIAAK